MNDAFMKPAKPFILVLSRAFFRRHFVAFYRDVIFHFVSVLAMWLDCNVISLGQSPFYLDQKIFCIFQFFLREQSFDGDIVIENAVQSPSLDWMPKQRDKTAQPKPDKYPASHFSPFNSCFSVVL